MSRPSYWNVLRFELRRTMTRSRLMIWALLSVFPAGLLAVMRFNGVQPPDDRLWTLALFVFIPEVTCLLGLLLWMTPAVQAELEGHSWVFLASRPRGRRNMLLGKYANAVVWTLSSAISSLSASIAIADLPDATQTFGILLLLTVLSTLSYGALFALIAVINPARAMVLAVAYTMLIEVVVGLIPALVNQLTIQFRLRSILFRTMQWSDVPAAMQISSEQPVWLHCLILAGITFGLLTVTCWLLERRQFVIADDG